MKKEIQTSKMLNWMWALILLSLWIQPSYAMGRGIKDEDITLAVETKLLRDEVIPSYLIDVNTKEGIVKLSGWVDNLLAKERAAEISEMIKGVRAVVNRIEVSPISKTPDREIQENIRRALWNHPATEIYEIDIEVTNGVVTLKGTVDSWQEKELCTKVAKGVEGVKGFKNDIVVKYQFGRPDDEIETEIKRRLEWDVWINHAFVDVKVKEGRVTLSGKAGSAAEKSRALMDAWVAGVKSVDHSGIQVDWMLSDEMRREYEYPVISDEKIKKAIKDAFLYDPRVFRFNPEVEVNDGVVVLTGTVNNLKAKKAAEQDAENTVGVWRVKNYLKVRPVKRLGDNEIAEKVLEAFFRDPMIDRNEITVSVYHSKVFLHGTVDTRYEKSVAEDIASSVKGVVEVRNNLEVRSGWKEKSDWEIKEDIEYELMWSPFVDANQVTVAVEDGMATLTGTVDSYMERGVAQDNAYEGGAKSVHNLLKVRYGPAYYIK